jgi:pilus assembly protein TadC
MSKELNKKFAAFKKKKANKKITKKKINLDDKFKQFKSKNKHTNKEKKGFFSNLFSKKDTIKNKIEIKKTIKVKKEKPIIPKTEKKEIIIKDEPKKIGIFSKLFKKKKKENIEDKLKSLKHKIKKDEDDKVDPLDKKLKDIKNKIDEDKKIDKKKEIKDQELKAKKEEIKKKSKEEQKNIAEEKEEPTNKKKSFLSLFKKKKSDSAEVKEKDIRKLFKKKSKERKSTTSAAQRRRQLSDYLEKSGLEIDQQKLSKNIFYIAMGLTIILTIIYVILNVKENGSILGIFGQVIIIWLLGFIVMWGLTWVIFRIYLDLIMFRRKLSVEEVLPDFLQLTAANLRAGMPIDRALWFAVRPRFGVLAKEIEDTAKKNIAGQPLNEALLDFAKRYDSNILKRTIYLLNEGMDAGGDVGDLLNKIALNIQQMRGIKKEMAANVTTYVIFISFASMVAAPALFGLSSELLHIVQSIAKDVAGAGGTSMGGGGGLSINISDDTIKMSNYTIFAYLSLTISSIFSAIIVSTIKKGNIKEGLHYIPIFAMVAVTIYFIATSLLRVLLGGMFG